jgi:tRNA(adenine34) deaminase
MVTDGSKVWEELAPSWRIAFEEAWTSWCSGSAGVGAVITDDGGRVVAQGRSRVFDIPDGRSPLIGTFMAHAEMNALASLPVGDYSGYTLTTTFEPCLMCAGAIRLYGIPQLAYASDDPLWDGLHDVFAQVPAIARRLASRRRLGGPLGAFAHVLHLSFFLRMGEEAPEHVLHAHASLAARHVGLAREIHATKLLEAIAEGGGSVLDALVSLWPALVTLAQDDN